jgi:hypothetical protein
MSVQPSVAKTRSLIESALEVHRPPSPSMIGTSIVLDRAKFHMPGTTVLGIIRRVVTPLQHRSWHQTQRDV